MRSLFTAGLLLAAKAAEDTEAPVISLNLASAALTSGDVRDAYDSKVCTTDGDCNGAGETCLPAKFLNGEIKSHVSQKYCCPPAGQMRDTRGVGTDNLNGGYFGEYCEIDTADSVKPKTSNSFADECEVVQNMDLLPPTAKKNCDEPSATAYDHHEGDISNSITTVWKLFVKSDPKALPVQQHTKYSNNPGAVASQALTGIDRAQRGEYVITYDVTDSAGNRAEQVQFALIMLDSYPPNLQTSLQSCNSAWNKPCSCPIWKSSGLPETGIVAGACANGDSVSGSFHGCAADHTPHTTEFCDFSSSSNTCGGETHLTAGVSQTYEVGQGEYKCLNGVVDATMLNAGKLITEANTHFTALSNVIAVDKYDGTVATTTVGGVNNADWKFSADFGSSCNGQKIITPASGEQMTIKTEDWADIFGHNNQNNKAQVDLAFAVQDTVPPQICKRSDGLDDGCAEDNIWRDFECGVSGILDSIDAKYPLFQKVNGGKGTDAWKPPYADCRDFFHFEKSSAGAYTGDNMFAAATPCSLAKLQEKVGAKTNFQACKADTAEVAQTFDAELEVPCTTNTDCSTGYHCLLNGDTSKCFKRVQTGSGFLQYTASDCSGNEACPLDQQFFVVDTIPPTLYLTSTEIDTAWNHDMLCGGADGKASHWSGANWVGEFCTNYADLMHKVSAKEQTITGSAHTAFHPGSAYTNAVLIQHSAGYATDYSFIEDLVTAGTGYLCFDLCSGADTSTSTSWSTESCGGAEGVFDMLKVGTYYLMYECKDKAGHTTSACRTISNEDKTKPVITILEASNTNEGIWTTEASRDSNYVDSGATCTDMVDGNISQDVEVSGDVVNMANPGTYRISYNCKDSAGQEADTGIRTVVVRDTTCPTCTLGSTAEELTVEASFPYSEEPTTCTDTLDGALTTVQTVTLDSDSAFTNTKVDVEMTGKYTITYCAKDGHSNGDVTEVDGVNTCTCSGSCADECKYRTVTVQDTIVPIIQLHYQDKDLVQNPSSHPTGFSYMAEVTNSANGWVVGAIASAVSGVALLGYSLSRKSTPTTVPV